MTLSQDTQRILEQVEQVTQKPVQLLPNPALPTLANIKAARGPLGLAVEPDLYFQPTPLSCLS